MNNRIALAEYLLEKSPDFHLRYIEWLEAKWIVIKQQKKPRPLPLIQRDVNGKQFRRAMLRSFRSIAKVKP